MKRTATLRIPSLLPLKPNRVWRTYLGGRQLDLLEGKREPRDSHFPEDWIASTTRAINPGREHLRDEGLSTAEIDGKEYLLRDLFARLPNEMLGARHADQYGPNTQFLLKLLDSSVRLHIQCHPTIEFSRAHLNSSSGKTEAYLILGSRPEIKQPYIYLGFQRVPDRQGFRCAILEQDTEALLSSFDKVPVQPGDVFVVPGGVPHAIGEGVFMIEVMEPTDFAVRIEFERGGYVLPESARFLGRDVDFALSMFDFEASSLAGLRRRYFQTPVHLSSWGKNAEFSLIDERATSCFRVRMLCVADAVTKTEQSFYVGVVSRGKGHMVSGTESTDLEFGDRFFVPYHTGLVTFTSDSELEIIRIFPPRPSV